jgi:hypothetical protein
VTKPAPFRTAPAADLRPDFDRVDLERVDLELFDFERADFERADFDALRADEREPRFAAMRASVRVVTLTLYGPGTRGARRVGRSG